MARAAIKNAQFGETVQFRFLGETLVGKFTGYTQGDRNWLDIATTPCGKLIHSIRRGDVYRGAVPSR